MADVFISYARTDKPRVAPIVAAIGLLAGAGMYWIAIFTTALALITLRLLRPASARGERPAGEPSITGDDVIRD